MSIQWCIHDWILQVTNQESGLPRFLNILKRLLQNAQKNIIKIYFFGTTCRLYRVQIIKIIKSYIGPPQPHIMSICTRCKAEFRAQTPLLVVALCRAGLSMPTVRRIRPISSSILAKWRWTVTWSIVRSILSEWDSIIWSSTTMIHGLTWMCFSRITFTAVWRCLVLVTSSCCNLKWKLLNV